ncbi:MFS transporter small subunit [Marmoricola endophyticus]
MSTTRIALSWALVGVPLLYGVVETVRKAATLFTG